MNLHDQLEETKKVLEMIQELLSRGAESSDTADQYVSALHEWSKTLRDLCVLSLRDKGVSLSDLGAILGVGRERVRQRSNKVQREIEKRAALPSSTEAPVSIDDVSVILLPFDSKTLNPLLKLKMNTVGDLRRWFQEGCPHIPDFGVKRINHIVNVLKTLGVEVSKGSA